MRGSKANSVDATASVGKIPSQKKGDAKTMISRIKQFTQLEAAGGMVLMAAAALALLVANSPLATDYFAARETYLGPLTLAYWVNDGLMALFFLLVGLEIKREFVVGELSTMSERILPGLAAIAGVVVPALVYLMVAGGNPGLVRGWAIPAATDIAFALGILALLGSRAPASLKIFVTAVAVIDDLIAVSIIALFYTEELNLLMLGLAAMGLAVLWMLNRRGVQALWPYFAIGLLVWLATLLSGVHATLAGVAVALTLPLQKSKDGKTARASSPLIRLEHGLHPWVAFIVVPVFGFVNAGVVLLGLDMAVLFSPLPLAIASGLLVGKFVGIYGAIILAVKLGWAKRPLGASWTDLAGVALLCGVGFTMSLFIGGLAFDDPAMGDLVRLGVISGSLVAGTLGAALIAITGGKKRT